LKNPTHCGYNNFSPSLLAKLPANSELNLAREGSVCVYVKGDVDADGFKNDERHFYADKKRTRFCGLSSFVPSSEFGGFMVILENH